MYATGCYWWKCQFPTSVGWVDAALLDAITVRVIEVTPTMGSTTTLIVGDPLEVSIGFDRSVAVAREHLVMSSVRWGAMSASSFGYEPEQKRAVWTFAGLKPETWTGTLSDSVTDEENGTALDGEISDPLDPFALPSGNRQPGGAAVFAFRLRTVYGDFDMDGDVDLVDFAHFQTCYHGPNVPVAPQCADANVDGPPLSADVDVDLTDFGIFQLCYSGPNRRPRINCAD